MPLDVLGRTRATLMHSTSSSFVHTARRCYRLNGPVRFSDWGSAAGSPAAFPWEVTQTLSF